MCHRSPHRVHWCKSTQMAQCGGASNTLPLCILKNRCRADTLAAHHFGALKKAVFSLCNATTQNHLEAYTLYQMHNTIQIFLHSTSHFTECHSSTCCQYWANWFSWPRRRIGESVCQIHPSVFDGGPFNCTSMGFAPVLKVLNVVAGGWYMIVMDGHHWQVQSHQQTSASL